MFTLVTTFIYNLFCMLISEFNSDTDKRNTHRELCRRKRAYVSSWCLGNW